MAQPFKPYTRVVFITELNASSIATPALDDVPAGELTRYANAGFANPYWNAEGITAATERAGFKITWVLIPL